MSNPTPAADGQIRVFWSSRSPFVRNVMITLHEVGLADHIEAVPVVVNGINVVPELEVLNPLAQIPTVEFPNGIVLYDSRVIVDYLNAVYGGGRLIPVEYPARLDVLRRAALAQGLTEKAMRWLLERFRPETGRSEELMVALARTVELTLDEMETEAANWTEVPVDAGHIGTAAILGYLDFRFAAIAWRETRPNLAAWHEEFSKRPSYTATEFVDSLAKAPAPVKV